LIWMKSQENKMLEKEKEIEKMARDKRRLKKKGWGWGLLVKKPQPGTQNGRKAMTLEKWGKPGKNSLLAVPHLCRGA